MLEVFETYLQRKLKITTSRFDELKPFLKAHSVRKGDIILRPGEICKGTNFVEKGCLRSYVVDGKGKEHIIYFAPENWWIADQNSLAKKEPAMFYIEAVEDSEVVFIPGEVMPKFELLVPGTEKMFAALSQNNIYAMQKRLINHLSATADERYSDFLETYPSLALRLSQKMIAAYIGVAPESLSRIRGQMAERR